jgi:gliotoxin biosynthesis N-methyltransferase
MSPRLFDTKLACSINLVEHSITGPWPADWNNSFDLVHQRLVLSAYDPPTAKTVLPSLFQLVKPGGWIQLLECDPSAGFGPDEGTQHPATAKLGDLVMSGLPSTSQDAQPARCIKRWLVETGAVDVVETIMDCPVGARATTPKLRDITTRNVLGVVQNLKMARDGELPSQNVFPSTLLILPFFDVLALIETPPLAATPNLNPNPDEPDFDQLHIELSAELTSKGSTQRFHLVYGRRPFGPKRVEVGKNG